MLLKQSTKGLKKQLWRTILPIKEKSQGLELKTKNILVIKKTARNKDFWIYHNKHK